MSSAYQAGSGLCWSQGRSRLPSVCEVTPPGQQSTVPPASLAVAESAHEVSTGCFVAALAFLTHLCRHEQVCITLGTPRNTCNRHESSGVPLPNFIESHSSSLVCVIRLLPQFLWWIEPSSAVYGVAQSQTRLKRLSSYSVEHWQISPLPFLRYCGHLTDPQVADCSYTLKRWTIHKHDISFLLTWSITWSWRPLLTCSICKLDPLRYEHLFFYEHQLGLSPSVFGSESRTRLTWV